MSVQESRWARASKNWYIAVWHGVCAPRAARVLPNILICWNAEDETEWEAFVNSLTTNLTSFFREPHHFPLLAEHLRKQEPGRPLTLWCSACSTGEEAYSMAMTAVEALGGYEHAVTSLLPTWIPKCCKRRAKGDTRRMS